MDQQQLELEQTAVVEFPERNLLKHFRSLCTSDMP